MKMKYFFIGTRTRLYVCVLCVLCTGAARVAIHQAAVKLLVKLQLSSGYITKVLRPFFSNQRGHQECDTAW